MADIFYHNSNRLAWTGAIDADSDDIRALLVGSGYTPNADHATTTDLGANELANGNGYTTGGDPVTCTVGDIDADNSVAIYSTAPSWTASGSPMGPFRYVIWYDLTASNALLMCHDIGADVTIAVGKTFEATPDADGLFKIAEA